MTRTFAKYSALAALLVSLLVLVTPASAATVERHEGVTFSFVNICNGDTIDVTADIIVRTNNGSSSLVMANAKGVGQTGVTYVITYNYFPSVNGNRTFTLVQNFIGSDGSHAQERYLFVFGLPGGYDQVKISQTCL
jgi:hypothetical protein